jgi:hypothetical protein
MLQYNRFIGLLRPGEGRKEGNMDKIKYYNRTREFCGPVEDAATDNPVIYAIIQAYAHGLIVTREEALSQMVVHLSRDWQEEQKRSVEMAAKFATPMTI